MSYPSHIRRYDWVNAFLTAAIHVVIARLGTSPGPYLNFRYVNRIYLQSVRASLSAITAFPQLYISDDELRYLFHLESELWDTDYRNYLTFYCTTYPPNLLQTFKFTHGFYLLERWLRAFIPPVGTGRRNRERDSLFHENTGLFTCNHNQCLESLGVPFSLLSSTSSVSSIGSGAWSTLAGISVPYRLRQLYIRLSGYADPVSIVEAGFKRTRRKLAKRLGRRYNRGLRSTWYDVMWHYSETVRYRAISPNSFSITQPFYWNRCVRWCSSLMATGMIEMASRSDGTNRISSLWQSAMSQNPILYSVFGTSRN